jgi:hypothetical protein
MIVDLVQHHVAITSTLAVFEMGLPGRPSIQPRVLDAMSPEARADMLAAKVGVTDLATLRRSVRRRTHSLSGSFQEGKFERAFVKAGGLLLARADTTGAGGGSLPAAATSAYNRVTACVPRDRIHWHEHRRESTIER